MRAAIYARRSNEQTGRSEESKSVTRQVENARAFATARGWTVLDEHVYVDDGISGAEFDRRPGLQKLRAACDHRPPFNVLIVSEQKSLGREAYETNFLIKELAQSGIDIVEYVHGRSLVPKTSLDKALSSMQSFADETHREQTRERVHETHKRLASKGFVTGGRVFGYRNVDICFGEDAHGRPLKSHVERRIVPEEAAVVVRIFEMYAAGDGLKKIAKTLTVDGAPKPAPFARKDGLAPVAAWSPSTIRTVLCRDLYRGRVVWNRSRKRDDWGQVDQKPRPADQWVETTVEELRIVSDDLWHQVASRRADVEGRTVRFASGRLSGRPPKHEARNLLAGLATCGLCGGGLVVETTKRKNGRRAEYVCHRHRHTGVCKNDVRFPADLLNEQILADVEAHALTPEAIEQVVALSERDDLRERHESLTKQIADKEKRVANLLELLELGRGQATLLDKLAELEGQVVDLKRTLADLQPVPRVPRQVLEDRLNDWRRLLRQSTTQARAVLQRVLAGRIVFTPRGESYDYRAETRFDRLFAGFVVKVPQPALGLDWSQPAAEGLEHLRPEDCIDYDYGKLLERFCGKGVASPPGFEPGFQP